MTKQRVGQCIYCGAVSPFSKEHYLPRCLGTFRGSDSLDDRICENCNGELSGLERDFCRTGTQGFFRKTDGIRGRKHHRSWDPFWDTVNGDPVIEAYDKATGVRYEPSGEGDGSVKLMRQLLIHHQDKRPESICISDEMAIDMDLLKDKLRELNIAKSKSIDIIGCSEDEMNAIEQVLDQLLKAGLPKDYETASVNSGSRDVRVVGIMTNEYIRAVAKIGFHYFLKQFPEFNGSEPEFDKIRAFIKRGQKTKGKSDTEMFVKRRKPISISQARGAMPDWFGHMLGAGIMGDRVVAWAQFFVNPRGYTHAYEISVGRNPSPLFYEETREHTFAYFEDGKQQGYDGEMKAAHRLKLWLPGLQ
ncbi:hypothetical protein ACFL6S_33845 [Candidatus Poribacteria bacterium]